MLVLAVFIGSFVGSWHLFNQGTYEFDSENLAVFFEEAKTAIFEYIESWHNRRRRHSELDYKTPQQVEDEILAA